MVIRKKEGHSMLKISDLYDLQHTAAKAYLEQYEYPWQALKGIKEFVTGLISTLDPEAYHEAAPDVWVHNSVSIAPTASLNGPAVIMEGTEVRPGAFIRGSVLVGKNCVVGNSTELKNVILFDNVQVPHYNYVGDSILGYRSHMGAGSITSNVKSDKTLVVVRDGEEKMETGLKKMGAMLGDYVEVGCNSVLNPGTIIGRHASVYPVSCVRGTIPANHIFKDAEHILLHEE